VQKPFLARPTRIGVLLTATVALLVTACSSSGNPAVRTVTRTAPNGHVTTGTTTPGGGASTSSSPKAPPAKPVHIKTLNSDGAQYGVGMPVIAFFSRKITSGKALQDATKVTVNGRPLNGAWYFEYSSYYKGYPIEAHWRPQNFWPAHSHVHVDIPAKGLSAGKGLAFDDSLTLDFSIGARHLAVVDDATHRMTVTSDGRLYGTFPVSLGLHATPTSRGVKVIMEKGRDISMRGPGYFDAHVKYTQRLTYGGEYLHSAPWNCVGQSGCVGPQNNIGRADSSNGCTNLRPADAIRLYHFLEVGDVVKYPNANGPAMQLGSGYGDWNINWGAWQSGGLVRTTT
jgi:lipoprotein-anchoring transpeptidase ErfK/SrfK